jgi:hypothetical protein
MVVGTPVTLDRDRLGSIGQQLSTAEIVFTTKTKASDQVGKALDSPELMALCAELRGAALRRFQAGAGFTHH